MSDNDKKDRQFLWYAIESSRAILLVYADNNNSMSPAVKKKVQEMYKKRKEKMNMSSGYEMELAKSLAQNRLDESNDPLPIAHVTNVVNHEKEGQSKWYV